MFGIVENVVGVVVSFNMADSFYSFVLYFRVFLFPVVVISYFLSCNYLKVKYVRVVV